MPRSVFMICAVVALAALVAVNGQNGPGYILDVGPHGETRHAPLSADERLFPQADGSLRDWRGHRVVLDRTRIDPRTGKPWREPTASILGDAEDQRAQDLISYGEIERRRIEREERFGPPQPRTPQPGDPGTAPPLARAAGGGPLVCQGVGRCVTHHFCAVIAGGTTYSQIAARGVANAYCPGNLVCCGNVKWDKIKADASAARTRRRFGTADAPVNAPGTPAALPTQPTAGATAAASPPRRTPPPIPADALRRTPPPIPADARRPPSTSATTATPARRTTPARPVVPREQRGPKLCMNGSGRCVKRAFCRANGNEFGFGGSGGCPVGLTCCAGIDLAKLKADAAARRAQRRAASPAGARPAGRL